VAADIPLATRIRTGSREEAIMIVTPRRVGAFVAVVLALVVAGCGSSSSAPESSAAGDIPDNQAYVEFRPPTGLFTVKVPEGWARTENGTVISFTDKLNSIRLESGSVAAAPTESTGRGDLDKIKGSATGFTAGAVSTVTRPAGPALLVTYRADAAADPVTGKVVNDDLERYQFFHDGHLVTLTLAGPHGSDNVDPWRTVTDSFRWSA
jgi:hypothetical protein